MKSSIIIGGFQFSGVEEVRIKKSMRNYTDTATIKIPSIAKIITNGVSGVETVTTGTKFQEGDAVHINLGYNGDLNSEFVGFVKRPGLGMPLVVECEGYVRQLRLNCDFNKAFATTSAKKLLALATQDTDISVVCPVDFPIANIVLQHANGAEICDYIKEASDHTLTIFFINPKTLWCGLPYTAYANGNGGLMKQPTVSYRLGFNCIKDNSLKERIPQEPVQIIMKGLLANGNFVTTASKNKAAANKIKTLHNHVPDSTTLSFFAQEKEYQHNYTGYEGKVHAFLQPYAQPGFNAYIQDSRYPALTGTYMIEETEVVFGLNGARRYVTIGPMVNQVQN